jgi:hypothetical protein
VTISTNLTGLSIRHQPFDGNGRLLCLGCDEPIQHGQFYLEVRQRDDLDSDPKLAVHVNCLTKIG